MYFTDVYARCPLLLLASTQSHEAFLARGLFHHRSESGMPFQPSAGWAGDMNSHRDVRKIVGQDLLARSLAPRALTSVPGHAVVVEVLPTIQLADH